MRSLDIRAVRNRSIITCERIGIDDFPSRKPRGDAGIGVLVAEMVGESIRSGLKAESPVVLARDTDAVSRFGKPDEDYAVLQTYVGNRRK